MKPLNLNYKKAVSTSFDRQGIMKTLGASLKNVEPGKCEIHLPFGDHLSQQHGYLHAGVVSTIADSAAGYAAYTLCSEGTSVLTTEFKINLLAPAKGDSFIAKAKVLKSGRTLQIVTREVYSVENGEERLCALLVATIMNMANKLEKESNERKG